MINYQPGAVATNGASIQSQIRAMQSEHQAIIRDALEAAAFWGGTRSRVWKLFMADLGRNFQVIYDHRNSVNMHPVASASASESSAALKPSPRRAPSFGRGWLASC